MKPEFQAPGQFTGGNGEFVSQLLEICFSILKDIQSHGGPNGRVWLEIRQHLAHGGSGLIYRILW
jgi:hypothetical protein